MRKVVPVSGTTIVELILPGEGSTDAAYAAVDEAGAEEVAGVIALVDHPLSEIRVAAMSALPLLTHGESPEPEIVAALVRGTRDDDPRVRDWACFGLGQQCREIDTPEVRDALADRLDDPDVDTAQEALLGLAYRHDLRTLPRVRAALSRPDEDVWILEVIAAGALGDPSLCPLVLRLQDGWDEEWARTADAALRLTDPDGPGDDILDGVAELYRRRSRHESDDDVLWAWTVMDAMLDIDPTRAPELLGQVRERLTKDEAAVRELEQRSALAVVAADQG